MINIIFRQVRAPAKRNLRPVRHTDRAFRSS